MQLSAILSTSYPIFHPDLSVSYTSCGDMEIFPIISAIST